MGVSDSWNHWAGSIDESGVQSLVQKHLCVRATIPSFPMSFLSVS